MEEIRCRGLDIDPCGGPEPAAGRFPERMIDLSPELEQQFTEQLSQYEEEKRMLYVTSVERLAREQGLEKGLLEGTEAVLRIRFGSRCESILAAIRQLSNVEILGQVLRAAQTVERPEDLSVVWSSPNIL